MKSQYKKELRIKRNEILTEWLKNSGYTKQSFVSEFGEDKLFELEKKYKGSLIRTQNRIRGLVGEFLGSEYLTSKLKAPIHQIIKDKKLFKTPFGGRRIDVFYVEKELCLEVKMGYLYNSLKIREQIKKDQFLLKKKIVQRVIWILYQDGSKNVKNNIIKSGLELNIGGTSGTEKIFNKDVNFILPNIQVLSNSLNNNNISDEDLTYVIYGLQIYFNKKNIPNEVLISWEKLVKPYWMKKPKDMKREILKWLKLNKKHLYTELEYNLFINKLK